MTSGLSTTRIMTVLHGFSLIPTPRDSTMKCTIWVNALLNYHKAFIFVYIEKYVEFFKLNESCSR